MSHKDRVFPDEQIIFFLQLVQIFGLIARDCLYDLTDIFIFLHDDKFKLIIFSDDLLAYFNCSGKMGL